VANESLCAVDDSVGRSWLTVLIRKLVMN